MEGVADRRNSYGFSTHQSDNDLSPAFAGEQNSDIKDVKTMFGLSPHLRGTVHHPHELHVFRRFIPAFAGNRLISCYCF
ncbi:hypothetical protein XBP1_1620019 [Xenorhabdus bovienii str. puntauvense]|uniref:Uncharacterized protein n=1 Tax=Xenorhabdus bovienii str. puntauvense TaxID=1398201 RepID=A0A077N171_XENBV|nr:hypothetical protein XBP1_1620019 [Xenorhabdus bovienii str. puntauvense]